jgi:hypothetical protein
VHRHFVTRRFRGLVTQSPSCEGWSLTEGPDWLALRLNSLNLMETGPKFCTAEERAAGPCLTHVPRP